MVGRNGLRSLRHVAVWGGEAQADVSRVYSERGGQQQMSDSECSLLDHLVRIPRGKCTGCDKVRVRYLYVWHSGRRGFPDGREFHEAYCRECVEWKEANAGHPNQEDGQWADEC